MQKKVTLQRLRSWGLQAQAGEERRNRKDVKVIILLQAGVLRIITA